MSDSGYQLAPFAPVLPEVSQRLLGNDGPAEQTAPAKLSEADRSQPGMIAFDSYLLHAFRLARYNTDVFIASRGYDELDQMLQLASYEFALRILKAATLYKTPKLLPRYASQKQADKLKDPGGYDESMRQFDFWNEALGEIVDPETDRRQTLKEVLWHVMDAVHPGFSATRMLWRQAGDESPSSLKGKWLLKECVPIRPKQLSFELDEQTLSIKHMYSTTPINGVDKRPIPLEAVMLMIFNQRGNLPYGWGMARICYKHWWLIEQTLRTWAIGVKKTGIPFFEGISKGPGGPARLAAMFSEMGEGLGIAHDGQDQIIPHVNTGNTMVVPEAFVRWNEEKIIQTVLGQTGTTSDGEHGSFAKSKVHQDTGNFFLSYPRHMLEDVFSMQCIGRGSAYNFGKDKRKYAPRLFLGHWNEEERMATMKLLEGYRNQGYVRAADIDWIREDAGFPPDMSTIALEDVLTPEGLPGRERVNEDFSNDPPPKPEDPSHRNPTDRRTNPDTGTPAKNRG